MNFDSRFVRKPAPRTESEVLIKSVVVITSIITPRKDKVVHSFNFEEGIEMVDGFYALRHLM
jgi:hypothetical protein